MLYWINGQTMAMSHSSGTAWISLPMTLYHFKRGDYSNRGKGMLATNYQD